MGISFTEDQLKVIELHNCNVLVSAAAGSGKTAVLVERIARMVCDEEHPVDIDRLLIVTFTNAAAQEMRERIGEAIAVRLEEHPESEHLQRQSALLHNALITTIDSFSLFIVRNHFNEISLDPNFRVADEGEIKLLQQEVLEELLENRYADGTDAFLDCVEYFCTGGKDTALEKHILDLAKYADSFPWPGDWLTERKKDYSATDMEGFIHNPCGDFMVEHIRGLLQGCVEKLNTAIRICESPDGPYMYGEMLEKERDGLEALLETADFVQLGEKVSGFAFGRLSGKKDDSVNASKKELVKSIRDSVKKTIGDLSERFFKTPAELMLVQSMGVVGPLDTLLDLTLDFVSRMQEKKKEKRLITFSDMEHYALDILLKKEGDQITPSQVALEYRDYFAEVLIDEYQDSNLVQEYLLMAVAKQEPGHCNRFMVGDVKQSIYRFRQARPELFLEKYETYGEEGDNRKLTLSKNFRSRTRVIDTVNKAFCGIMSAQCGGIVYDEAAALYPGAVYPENAGCESELILVEKPDQEDEMEGKEAEGMAIAARIKELLGSFRVTDKKTGELRPVGYRDMVILLRTTSGWDEELRDALERQGIPAYVTSKTGYFQATEVQEVLNYLRILSNPYQDIPLFGVLHSYFGGLTDEELAILRGEQKEGRLYEAVLAYREAHPQAALSEKLSAFLERFESYRQDMVYLPIRELLEQIIGDYDYLNYITALPAGQKRRANVEMLFTKASAFGATSFFGVFHFVRYMEQLEKYDMDEGEADILDENADVVRIMSIHKSKGLEFPVVFVAGMGKQFNLRDADRFLLADNEFGMGVDFVDPVKRIRNKTLRKMILSQKLKRDTLAEELRILYVALTRAREKLILTATGDYSHDMVETRRAAGLLSTGKLNYLEFMKASCYMDFLLPVLDDMDLRISYRSAADFRIEQLEEDMGAYEKRMLLVQGDYPVEEEKLKLLKERFAFVYPYSCLEQLYTKTTVSELKIAAMAEKDEAAFHTFEEPEVVPYIPAFKREKEEVTGTVRGNAYHRVMELLDFEAVLGKDVAESFEAYVEQTDWAAVADRFRESMAKQTESMRLEKEYAECIRAERILELLRSPLGYRMWRAHQDGLLHREQPFVLGLPASRVNSAFPEEEQVLIQGIIDVFFEEDGELVLLDYKTDSVPSLQALWDRYETQLDYYQEALEKLTGKKVKERILYSFHLGKYE